MEDTGQKLYLKAKKVIPGGTQLFSKRPECFLPEQWPSYYSKASGVEVVDLDGNTYIDMSYNGIGACILGFAHSYVDNAVKAAIDSGTMATLNCAEEVELADLLCEIHPWAQMVRYARTGGEAMAIAVRIARAKTGRDKVAFCGYHGWHDWYLAANLNKEDALNGHLLPGLKPAGVPKALIGTSFPFHYNRLEELKKIVSNNGNRLAAIIIETIRSEYPKQGFLENIKEIAKDIKAVLIFDEISCGWRLNSGGAHLLFGITPDMAVFGKALSNGYPMAAIIGIGSVMEAAQDSFISSTYWTERIGPTAALATIQFHQRNNVAEHLVNIGKIVQDGWKELAKRNGLDISIGGIPPISYFTFNYKNGQAIKTLFTQLMLEKGYLATNTIYITYAHQKNHIEKYLISVNEAFVFIAEAIKNERVESSLKGPITHSGFYRLA